MAPKRTTRSTPATTTTITTTMTNAQLKVMIDQGVTEALVARDADRIINGNDSHNSGTGVKRAGLEYGRYSVSKDLDTAYRGFLGVGTTFDIFQNILFPYSLNMAYCLLLDTAYWILFPSWSLVSAGIDTPYLP
ncbi:hypothetical protein Tco_0742428 [Tanacetum coccineum]